MSDLLKYHQWCISDPVAMAAYEEAIRRTVRPGDVVLDLGAGTGILGFMACRAGARKVYAAEPSDIIALIPRLAADNGFADRLIVKKCESFDVEFPQRADVLIASMLGSAGIGNNMLRVVLDARERLLKPGGAVIPMAIQPIFCPVTLPDWYKTTIEWWDQPQMGLRWDSIRDIAVNRAGSCRIKEESLLAAPQSFHEIPLATFRSANVEATLRFEIKRAGTVHALAGWIEIKMADGIRCSDSPLDSKPMPWDQLILPVTSPVSVEPGDQVKATIRASSVGKNTVLLWDIWFHDAGGALRADFHHSSFQGFLLAKENLVNATLDSTSMEAALKR